MEHVTRRQVVYLPVGVAVKALDPIVLLSLLEHWKVTGQMRAASQTSRTKLTVRTISYGNLQGRDGEELQSL